jgi:hypothetical protein
MPTNITMKPYIQMPRFGKLSTVSSTAKIHHVRPCTKGRGSFLSCRAQGYFHHQSVPRFFPTFLRPRLRVVRLYIFFFRAFQLRTFVLLRGAIGPRRPPRPRSSSGNSSMHRTVCSCFCITVWAFELFIVEDDIIYVLIAVFALFVITGAFHPYQN